LLPLLHPQERVFEKNMLQDHGFTEEQKQYLKGFITAIVKKCGLEMPTASASSQDNAQITSNPSNEEQPSDPTHIHVEAQNRAAQAGGQLVPEELAKREKHPFDMWDEMLANAAAERFPKGLDIDQRHRQMHRDLLVSLRFHR
jgi:ferredoxin-nitrite reductase